MVPLDLRSSSKQLPPVGMGNARVIENDKVIEFAASARHYIAEVADDLGLTIQAIGIDAPSCYADEQTGRRKAEEALNNAGISCFATPAKQRFEGIVEKARQHIESDEPVSRMPHANQLWMLAGFALFDSLSNIAECREVYPHASAHALGAADVYKTKPEGLANQATAVSRHTGWPASVGDLDGIGFGARHDNLDAYLAAWVASLDESELDAYGQPPGDVIWVPKVGTEKFDVARPAPTASYDVVATTGSGTPCPACNDHVFKRWPWGWDAHAAHRCSGLKPGAPEARKQEFRERFL